MQQQMHRLANLIYWQMQKFDNVQIRKALEILLADSGLFEIINNVEKTSCNRFSAEKFQETLASFNEKTSNRKDNGVYYTSSDVSRYIVINSLLNKYYDQTEVLSYNEGIRQLAELSCEQQEEFFYKLKIVDPTCGGGEFIMAAFDIKIELHKEPSDEDFLRIAKTVFGNDIDPLSVLVCKIRLFFHICEKLNNKSSYVKLAKLLCKQFYCVDFVLNHKDIKNKFDITVGNPPYVEYGKCPNPPLLKNEFGNIYADVLKNSFDILNKDGAIGYIIPISYSSTPRMKAIRDYIQSQTTTQFVLSFADRPDCLFNGVHQKLNIVIAKKGQGVDKIYTSNYRYWYKNERDCLFNGISVIQNNHVQAGFIPKIGNSIEQSIYHKVCSNGRANITALIRESEHRVYLNMRACFWVKAFTFNPGSKEYKKFCFSKAHKDYAMCVLNSSLFWFFWILVSDCWHITAKDLCNFWVPNMPQTDKFRQLAKELEDKLEQTKKYIGTKQTEYEYKHRLCKDIIDKIDEELSTIYGLTSEELEYIQNYALKYRKGDGSLEKSR